MSLYESIKDVANIVQKADNIDLYQKILDLQQEALDMIEENRDLKEKIRQLEDNTNIEEKLVFKENKYYLKKENGIEVGPFCTVCWDINKKLVRLHFESGTKYNCNACKTIIGKPEVYAPRKKSNGIIN